MILLVLLATLQPCDPTNGPPPYVPRVLHGVPDDVALAAQMAGIVGDVDPVYVLASFAAESSLRLHVTGDHGRAVGIGQVHAAEWRMPWLTVDSPAVVQGVSIGFVWRRLIGKVGRANASRAYAAGRAWRRMPWRTPPRWLRFLKPDDRTDIRMTPRGYAGT